MKWVSWDYRHDCYNVGIKSLGLTLFMNFLLVQHRVRLGKHKRDSNSLF